MAHTALHGWAWCPRAQQPHTQLHSWPQTRQPARRRLGRCQQKRLCIAATPLQVSDVAAGPSQGSSAADTTSVQLQLPRRRLEVTFTCNKCGGRSTRLVNPDAWARGTVFVQCQQCDVWHKIRDEAHLIEEVSGPGAVSLSSDGSGSSDSSGSSSSSSHADTTKGA